MMRLLRLTHAWAGTILSLLLAILGLSGALLVFKNDYLRASVPAASARINLDASAFAKAVSQIEVDSASRKIKFITLADDRLGVHQVGFKDETAAFADANGELVMEWAKNGRIEEWLLDLHHHLLGGDTGEAVAGAAGLLAVIMTLTGIIIWWPTMRLFSLRVIPRTLKRADLVATHRNLGALMALPVIFLALTGASIAFADQTRWFLAQVLPSQEAPKPPKASPGSLEWTAALTRAQAAFPGAALRLIIWPKKPTDPMTVRMRQPAEWHPNGRTLVWINSNNGQILGTVDALKLKPAQSVFNAVYPLHAAKVGNGITGRTLDVMSALTGLALASLGLIGAFSFLRTLTSQKKKRAAMLPLA
jgi:uncharacterized iron-regulated membrane protein